MPTHEGSCLNIECINNIKYIESGINQASNIISILPESIKSHIIENCDLDTGKNLIELLSSCEELMCEIKKYYSIK